MAMTAWVGVQNANVPGTGETSAVATDLTTALLTAVQAHCPTSDPRYLGDLENNALNQGMRPAKPAGFCPRFCTDGAERTRIDL